jgi:hypothetical protein
LDCGKLPLQRRDLGIFSVELTGLALCFVEEHCWQQVIGDRFRLAVSAIESCVKFL